MAEARRRRWWPAGGYRPLSARLPAADGTIPPHVHALPRPPLRIPRRGAAAGTDGGPRRDGRRSRGDHGARTCPGRWVPAPPLSPRATPPRPSGPARGVRSNRAAPPDQGASVPPPAQPPRLARDRGRGVPGLLRVIL